MRIHFPNAEHADVPVDAGRMLVGSAVSGLDTLTLPGIAPEHLLFEVDSVRGIWLQVMATTPPVLVNGRPVRERAYLRLGDNLHLGQIRMVVKPDSDYRDKPPAPKPAETQTRQLPGRASLRAVAGQYFGKLIALKARTVIGRGNDCDLVLNEPDMARRHALIENTPQGLYLRDAGSSQGTFVNGVLVNETILVPGDQLAFAQNHFLIEAPGWQAQAEAPTPPPPRQSSTQVGYKLVPPPPAGPQLPTGATAAAARRAAANPPVPVAAQRSSKLANWILALAALVTLVALGTVIFLTVNGNG